MPVGSSKALSVVSEQTKVGGELIPFKAAGS